MLILERPWNDDNVQAVLRTAESFGIQHVWTIKHPHTRKRAHRSVTKGSHLWITRRFFREIDECVAAAREEGLELWVTGAVVATARAVWPQCLPGPRQWSSRPKMQVSEFRDCLERLDS